MSGTAGRIVTDTLPYDGGRQVSVYLPSSRPTAIVFAADGRSIAQWGDLLNTAHTPPTAIVGVHGLTDDTKRLEEYSPVFNHARFESHEKFFVDEVPKWVRETFDIDLPAARTAVFGASAGGELAIALGLRHPDVYGAILSGSPGAGYQPPPSIAAPIPRAYLVAGTQEPFFLKNAARWASALKSAGGKVVFVQRDADHSPALWRAEFPRMVDWAFA